MGRISVEGSRNAVNAGIIKGDYTVNNTVVNLEFSFIDLYKFLDMGDNAIEKSLINITEAQNRLSEAINTFAKTELIRAEADKLRAKADENNSLANLNYSNIMLEDREIIKQIMEKLK